MSDSLRKDLDRAKGLRKLLERAMDRTPDDMPLERRKAAAATQLDDKVGPAWREEAKVPGLLVIETKTLDAAPSRPAKAADQRRDQRNDFFDGVRKALAGEEEDGSWVQDDSGQEGQASAETSMDARLSKVEQMLDELRCLLEGRKSER